jgi:hypothetical protein
MILDKVEVTVYFHGQAITVSVSRQRLVDIGSRGEPVAKLVLAELVDLHVIKHNNDAETAARSAADSDDPFGLSYADLSPERIAMYKLFLLPNLAREVVPQQLRDIGRHFGRGKKVVTIDMDLDDMEEVRYRTI